MTDGSESDDREVGYGKPPVSTRFRKGKSGNPGGRPRGRHNEPPYEAVLGQIVTIRENGVERHVTAAEAFLLHIAKQGLEGDGAAARAAMAAIENARATRPTTPELPTIITEYVKPGSVNTALRPLRMARKLDRLRESARMILEPWIVEAALGRLGDQRFTTQEQEAIVRATRTPSKVRWPNWWEVKG